MVDRSRLAASVAAVLAVGTVAWAAEPGVQQDARIKELESKVAALEAQQAANSKDLAATIDAVLRDAEKRSQLLANDQMGAGYDGGFYIKGGDWLLKPGAQFQFRHIVNYRDNVIEDGGDDDDSIENGFEVRRMKFSLEGTAFTPDLKYVFVWATDRNSGDMFLEDAFATYKFADQWGVRMGQHKDPVHHEELTSSKRQLAVDRSLLNELLGGGLLDRTQGVSLLYGMYAKDSPLNVELMIHDGLNEDNTNFTDDDFEWGVAGRVEFKAMGDWKAYSDFSAKGNKEDLLVLGAGGDWSQWGDGNVLSGTVDAQWETATGLGVYAAGLVVYQDEEISGSGDDQTDWGVLAQVGYLLNPSWEVFGRWDMTVFDLDQVADEDTFHEFTVGVNYFLGADGGAFHRAKFTVDLTYLPNGAPDSDTGIGILDENDGDDEWILRAQFQLLI